MQNYIIFILGLMLVIELGWQTRILFMATRHRGLAMSQALATVQELVKFWEENDGLSRLPVSLARKIATPGQAPMFANLCALLIADIDLETGEVRQPDPIRIAHAREQIEALFES